MWVGQRVRVHNNCERMFSVNPAITKKATKNVLPKAILNKIKLHQLFHAKDQRNIQVLNYSQTEGFFMALCVLERKVSWLWWRHSKTFSVDYLNNIKICCAGILILKFNSLCRINEPVNQELFNIWMKFLKFPCFKQRNHK